MTRILAGLIRIEAYASAGTAGIFQVASAVIRQDFTFWSACMIALSVQCSVLVIGLWLVEAEKLEMRDILRYLDQFRLARFRRVPLNELLSPRVLAEARGSLDKQDVDLLNELVRIYVVTKGRDNRKPQCPNSFTSLNERFVFLTEEPKQISGLLRFHMYHELGHVSGMNYVVWRSKLGSLPLILVLLWVGPQLGFTELLNEPYILVIFVNAIFMTVAVQHKYWPILGQIGRVHDEVDADCFALDLLNNDDLGSVMRIYPKYPPVDPNMGPRGNASRRDTVINAMIQATLNRSSVGRLLPPIAQMFAPIIGSMIVAAVLAYQAQPADILRVNIALGITAVMIILMVLSLKGRPRLKKTIDLLLSDVDSFSRAGRNLATDKVAEWPKESAWQANIWNWLGLTTSLSPP
jgi:hypothetical protein